MHQADVAAAVAKQHQVLTQYAQRHRQIVQLFVLSPIAPVERHRFIGQEGILDEVSGLLTLKELSADEVDAAFWVGRRVAHGYLPQIYRAAAVADCPDIALPEPP